MRRAAVLLLLLSSPATAQPYPGQPYPGQAYPPQPYPAQPYPPQPYPAQPYAQPPYPAQPPAMQPAPAEPMAPSPGAGWAPASGARPGNDIGTGMSLPRSNNASNINEATTHSELAPNLPAPAADTVPGLLFAARNALAARQTGAAQEALERAETRALDRSIPVGTERVPDQGRMVAAIGQARQALAAGDLNGAIQIIDGVLAR
jgi:hypothetical protein